MLQRVKLTRAANTEDMKYLYGFIRLSYNNNKKNGPFKTNDMALIRELHVYGSVEKVNEKEQTSTSTYGIKENDRKRQNVLPGIMDIMKWQLFRHY